jgi:hypothetical protein
MAIAPDETLETLERMKRGYIQTMEGNLRHTADLREKLLRQDAIQAGFQKKLDAVQWAITTLNAQQGAK